MTENRKSPKKFNLGLGKTILQYLVFIALAVGLYFVIAGLGEQDIPTNRAWIAALLIAGLIIIPVVHSLTELGITKTGVSAKFEHTQQEYSELVSEYENVDESVSEQAIKEIAKATSIEDMQTSLENVRLMNTSKNMQTVKDAISETKKVFVRYKALNDTVARIFYLIPLDIKQGTTPNTIYRDYLMVYDEKDQEPKTLRWDRILKIEKSEEDFEPGNIPDIQELAKNFKFVREWGIH